MRIIHITTLFFLILLCSSCKKYLEAIPDSQLAVPVTLADIQPLMDENRMTNSEPMYMELGADNYYVAAGTWQAYNPTVRNIYTWAKDVNEGRTDPNWTNSYGQPIMRANTALDALSTISIAESERNTYNYVKGQALYHRSFSFFNLAQLYCKPFNAGTASTDPGIVLRTSSDLNLKSVRATIQATYDRIIADLLEAKAYLPAKVEMVYKTRTSKPAALGLLARVYLSMGDYTNAHRYCDSVLSLHDTLIDFNTINIALTRPLPNPNAESLQSTLIAGDIAVNANVFVDTLLYRSYATNDLRRTVYFKNNATRPYFAGQYEPANAQLYNGVAIDEIYLIRAECFAREGKTANALADLNKLLEKRWVKNTFTPFTATSSEAALDLVLAERRKELLFRGLRWTDLRRLNTQSRYAVTLTRIINNVTYTLPPNDSRYVLQIPDNEIALSGIQQNTR